METTSAHTSTTLLANVAHGGNSHAERLFFDRYEPLAETVARAAWIHANDLDDVVQEALVAAVQGLREKRYERPRGPFKAWFKGILFHKIAHCRENNARRLNKHIGSSADFLEVAADLALTQSEQVEAAFEAEWEKVLFEEACDEVRQRVAPVNWQAFDLVQRHGLKPAKVAKLLGIERSQVYNAVSRIREHLQLIISDLKAS